MKDEWSLPSEFPYPVIRRLGRRAFAAETLLVSHNDGEAVCKWFKPGMDEYFNREVCGLRVAERLCVGPRLIEVGANWVVIEYLAGYKELTTAWHGLLPLSVCRRAFELNRGMHLYGYANFDFCPENVLVNGDGSIKLIDFENVYRYHGDDISYSCNPVFVDRDFLRRAHVEGDPEVLATYATSWQPWVGVDAGDFISGRNKTLKRLIHILQKRLPGKVRRMSLAIIRGAASHD
jgi:hypothetical protein